MGEVIRRETAKKTFEFNGERFTSDVSGQIAIEHYHRYLLARAFCRGRSVLDVASGEGYGAALLAQVAASVTGVEIDAASVAHAAESFGRPNLRYLQGDARALPLPDDSIDVAVSFETLEHLDDQNRFLAEIRRVLRPDGLLVISTPDRIVYSPPGAPPNPFHVHELTAREFESALRSVFPNVTLMAQRPMIGSAILPSGQGGPPLVFDRQGEGYFEATDYMPRAPYLIAFASAAALPELSASLYIERSDLDTDPRVRADAELAMIGMRGALEKAQEKAQADRERAAADLSDLQARVAALSARADSAENAARLSAADAIAKQNAATGLSRQLAASEARLLAMETSTSWRLTAPVRRLVERHPRTGRVVTLGVKAAWWTLTGQLPERLRLRRLHRARSAAFMPPAPADFDPPLLDTPDGPIRLRTSDAPRVSVIIPTYGQDDFTLRCLASIAAYPPIAAIEVIVMDDAYPKRQDPSFLQARVAGARIVRNAGNLGFLRTCNAAAELARGEYLFFLNNDTQLRPGAIDALADLLLARPDIGMTGSKLVYPNGLLQEAGGIIWQDATGWNFGRNQDPGRPEYNYRRPVDYISGAAIMIRRDLFETLGGFDTDFSPAYYEDTDLAFRVRAGGFGVVYEPRSVVVHYEGMSHGTDLASGVKAHQLVNAKLMRTRWAEVLDRSHFAGAADLVRAYDQARDRKIILVIDHYVPEPDRDAGSRTIMGVLRSLVESGWVVKFWPQNRAYSPVYTPVLQDMGIEVLDHRRPDDLGAWLAQRGDALDCVLVSRPSVAMELLPPLLAHRRARLCFYGHDLHFERMHREAMLTGDAGQMRAAEEMKQIERRMWRAFDTSIYLSQEEVDTARKLEPERDFRAVVPYGFADFTHRDRVTPGSTILFVAGFAHPPNEDAALFLVNDVMPLVLAQRPDARLLLVGSQPSPAVRALASAVVTVTGWVSDAQLDEYYGASRATVVPLRFGAGVKGKVVEALRQGVPLTVTPIGAEGIDGLPDILPISRTARDIADDLLRMLNDDAAWLARSHAQTRFAQARFSDEAVRRSVIAALEP